MESDNFTNLTIHRSEVDAWKRGRRRGHSANGRMALWLHSANSPMALWLTWMAGVSLLAYGARVAARRSRSTPWSIASGATLLGYAVARLGTRHWRRVVASGGKTLTAEVLGLVQTDSFPARYEP